MISHVFSSLLCKWSVMCKALGLALRLPEGKKMKPWTNHQLLSSKHSLSCWHNTQFKDRPESYLTTSGKSPHWSQAWSKMAACGPCQHGQDCTQQCSLSHYMLRVAQIEWLSVSGLNNLYSACNECKQWGARKSVCYACLRVAFSTGAS